MSDTSLDGVGFFLHAMLNPPEQSGPPWTLSFTPPACECNAVECACPPPSPVSLTLDWQDVEAEPVQSPPLRHLQRDILRAFRLKPRHIGLGVPPLAIDGHEYRRRQRNRRRRRQ